MIPAPISPRGFGHAVLLMAACVVFAYANTLNNSFHYDDDHSLVGNPHLRRLENIPHFFTDPQMFSRNVGSAMYRPLVLVTYAFNYALGGYRVEGYHLLNIVLHFGCACLCFGVLATLGIREKWALAGGLLFAVHPLGAEPVNYISSRSESLAGLFLLASFFFYTRSRRPFSPLSLLCFIAALLSKEIAVSLVGLLLIYDLLWRSVPIKTVWFRHAPYWGLTLLYLWGTRALVQEAVIDAPVRTWGVQFCTQLKALVYYAKLLMAPQPLSVEHQFFPVTSQFDPALVAAGLLLLSTAWLAWRGIRSGVRAGAFWLGWIFLVLAPTLVVPLNVLVNERRLYLALVGFAGFALWACRNLQWTHKTRMLASLGFFFLLLLTVQYNQVWATEQTLWQHAHRSAPLMVRPHLRLGILYGEAGEKERAEAAYERALELDPENAPAHNNLGNLYKGNGDYEAAESAYNKALEILPNYPEALINLADLYGKTNRLPEALELYERILPLSPNREASHNNLGIAYLKLSRFSDAEQALRRALELNPSSVKILYNLGGALEGQEKALQAAQVYERAVQLDPRHYKTQYKLGLLYLEAGRRQEARRAFELCLRHTADARLAEDVRRRLERLGWNGHL